MARFYACRFDPSYCRMSNVRSRLLQASGASGVSLAARMLEQLLLVPVLLAAWSVELFGEWMLIAAIPVYLSLLDFGIVQSGSNELARRAGEGDEKGLQRFFREYSSSFLLWSLILLIVLLVVVALVPAASWLGLTRISEGEAGAIFALLIAGTLVSQNSLTLIAGLRARRQLPAGLFVRAGGALLRLAGAFITVLLFDAGPVALAAILLLSRIGEYAVQALLLSRDNLPASFNPFRKNQEKLLGLLGSGMEFMLFPLAQAMMLQGAVLIVGFAYGAVAVALFVAHRTLARMTSQIAQLAVVPLRAEAGLLQGEEHRQELGAILLSVSRLTLWSASGIALVTLTLGPWFFALWTGGKIAFDFGLLALLLLASVLETFWSVTSTIRMGTNRHRPLAWSYLGVSIVGAGLMVALASSASLEVAALALISTELVMAMVAIPLTLTLVGLDGRSFLTGHLRPPIAELRAIANRLQLGGKGSQ